MPYNSTFLERYLRILKNARVTPIYKGKGSQLEADNYRPISVVKTVTKSIEKIAKTEIISHL